MEGSVITEEMRSLVGKWQGEPYVGGQVHLEDIRRFAKAVGDNNPLWSDVDYAANTRWGGVIAPPTFVDRFTPFYVLGDDNEQGYLGGPMPVPRIFRHGFSAGDEYESFKAVRPGDVITATTTVAGIFEKQSRPGIGRMLFTRYDKTYRNQRNEIATICRWTSVGYEGPPESEPVPQGPGPETSKTIPEGQEPRVAQWDDQWVTPVYFDDVDEGDKLEPLDRYQTQKRFVRYAQASNDLSDIHYDLKLMQGRGMPDVVGQGALTSAYIASMVTNWCSPGGFLNKLSLQYRHYSLPGDVITTSGVVTSKRQENGQNLVTCDVRAENQNGRTVTIGSAVVSLPRRGE
jgi:acyl dehydratase